MAAFEMVWYYQDLEVRRIVSASVDRLISIHRDCTGNRSSTPVLPSAILNGSVITCYLRQNRTRAVSVIDLVFFSSLVMGELEKALMFISMIHSKQLVALGVQVAAQAEAYLPGIPTPSLMFTVPSCSSSGVIAGAEDGLVSLAKCERNPPVVDQSDAHSHKLLSSDPIA